MARVLIADDDARFRSLARKAVTARGHDVIAEAPDAATALSLAREEAPDIALIDVHLGTDSGWTLAAALHSLGIPRLIMLSSDPDAHHGTPDLLRPHLTFTPKPALAALPL